MNRCPLTYRECGNQKYSQEGLKLFSNKLKLDPDFPFSAAEQITLAGKYATKLSIAGVQPKLSVRLNIPNHRFEVVDRGGVYIIKPPHPIYPELPENEDLTMRLAKTTGIDVPFHGLIYGSDGSRSYLIKRFDRYGHGKKHAIEDFSQLSNHTRDTKYDSSMEKLIPILEEHCSFPVLEKVKLFRLMLFCFLVGNEDMHLKNFSLIRRQNKVELSPAYDLVNSTIVIDGSEELALPVAGKRSKITRSILCDYYGSKMLELNSNVIKNEMRSLHQASKGWDDFIQQSFLSQEMQKKYRSLLIQRCERLFL
jgi:serine/threonine-protein kinase HipA